MTKFRLYYDKDKETKWINEMAANGYAMSGFFAGFFNFEKCEPGEYVYQIDFGDKMFSVNNDYREFMAEQGVEIVCVWGYWIILRKHAADGEFKLYTDVDSSIEHYTKILTMFKAVTIIEFICLMIETFCTMNGASAGFLFMLILGILTIALMRATLSTKRHINELKERKGEAPATGLASGKVSPVLATGLLMNLCGIALKDSTISPTIVTVVEIIAIILMFIGLFQSRNVFKD